MTVGALRNLLHVFTSAWIKSLRTLRLSASALKTNNHELRTSPPLPLSTDRKYTKRDGRAEVEVSGNVTAANVARLVDLGVDYVSSGALTHSAPILDLSLKHLRVIG